MAKDIESVFDANHALVEIERLGRSSKTVNWSPTKNHNFSLIIPPTVYPPRDDTNLLAKRLLSFGPGRARKFLEIGCGSGALSVLASSLGWEVYGCDINPYAVASTRGNLDTNLQSGTIKEGGVGPEKFPFNSKFDLIIWNLPYIPVSEVSEVLGPMEEAALLDTDNKGLAKRFISTIESNELLAQNGRILLLGRNDSVQNSDTFAIRRWDDLEFDDGEILTIFCLWRPYENAENKYVQTTGSTNDDLMDKDGVGTHISSSWQTSGKGRRDRIWHSIEGCYAGSWIVAQGTEINPGLLQLSGGLAVLKSIADERLKLKWPNDIFLKNRKLSGILVEGKTSKGLTKAILGIGINLTSKHEIENLEIASVDELKNTTHSEIDKRLNCEIASLIEERDNLPPVDFDSIKTEVLSEMRKFGKPKYLGNVYDDFELNEKGELILGNLVIDDGEVVEWI